MLAETPDDNTTRPAVLAKLHDIDLGAARKRADAESQRARLIILPAGTQRFVERHELIRRAFAG